MKSWKTTACGICAVVMALASALKALWDGVAATQPDWPTLLAAISAGVGLFVARDNDKSSESVGAK